MATVDEIATLALFLQRTLDKLPPGGIPERLQHASESCIAVCRAFVAEAATGQVQGLPMDDLYAALKLLRLTLEALGVDSP